MKYMQCFYLQQKSNALTDKLHPTFGAFIYVKKGSFYISVYGTYLGVTELTEILLPLANKISDISPVVQYRSKVSYQSRRVSGATRIA